MDLGLFNGCALYEDGRVACWDRPHADATGTIEIVSGLPKIDRLEVGFHFACARAAEDQSLYCWGGNEAGQLGRGVKSKVSETPTKVTLGARSPVVAKDFLVGSGHLCVLSPTGEVSCVGSNVSGQCGKRPAQVGGAWVPVVTPNVVFRGAVRLFGGEETSCAVDAAEKLHCWGGQDGGYSGKGDTFTPRAIKTPGPVRAMSFATGHSCVLADDGSVHCRGWNPGGELGSAGRPQKELDGLGAFDDDFEPELVRVVELKDRYVSIAAARHETCAVSTSGTLTCIGTPDWLTRLSRVSRGAGPAPRTGTCTFEPVPPPASYKPPPAPRGSSMPPTPATFTRARCTGAPELGLADVVSVSATMGRRCTVHRDGRARCVGERGDGAPGIDDTPVVLALPE